MRGISSRAFTLLELLVAAAITLVLAALMLSVTSSLLSLWRRSQAGSVQAAAARQVFDRLEQDLQAAIRRRDSRRWLAVDILDTPAGLANHGWLTASARLKPAAGGSLRLQPPGEGGIADARFGLSGTWLRFVTTNIESGGSLPVAVAYQLVRRPVTGEPIATNPAPVRYSLYRSIVSNAETLSGGYDVTAGGYASPSNSPSALYRTPRNLMNPSQANLLASNVVDFGIWLHVREADGSLRLIYPSSEADLSHHASGSSVAFDSRYPYAAEVMIRILTEDGMTQLEAIETNRVSQRPPVYASDADWWWGVVKANSRIFTHRIEIKGTAL